MTNWKRLIQKEGVSFEAKKCSNTLPQSFWPTYSSFANTFGGTIVLGLTEDPEKRSTLTPTGVTDPDKIIRDIWDQVNNTQKVSVNILNESDVYIIDADGHHLVVVDVPRAERAKRPVYINNNMNNGTYRRNGEGDYHCSMAEISEMIRDSTERSSDSKLTENARLSDLDPKSLSAYRQMFTNLMPTHVWSTISDEEFLRVIGAADYDEKGILRPTMAGLLMFSWDYTITKELPKYSLDCFFYNDDGEWYNRISSDSGDWAGNLFSFSNMVLSTLYSDSDKPFSLNGVVRVDDNDRIKAERELMMNALIHADYEGTGGIRIEVRPDTLTLYNPGTLRIPLKKILEGGCSDPRNRSIMKMFRLIGLVERAESGIPRVISVCEKIGIPRPLIEEMTDPTRIKVAVTRIAKNNVSVSIRRDVTENMLIDLLSEHGDYTIEKMAGELGCSTSKISRLLDGLKEKGFIERIGTKKKGTWVVK